jgi:uncharacterized protein (UPF0335 family)
MPNEEVQDLLVKLTRLEGKIDNILENIKDIPDRVRCLEADSKVHAESISTIKSEIEKLRTTNTIWSFFNSIAIGIATILGISR